MLKILSAEQIKALDAYTIQHDPISSIDLMEQACRSFVKWFNRRFNSKNVIYIFCGTGNNGGDGLGIARLLHEGNYNVQAFVIVGSAPETLDFKINLERLSKLMLVNKISKEAEIPDCTKADVIIDGIFGSGISRNIEGLYADVISSMNQAAATRIAIDMPSGLRPDDPSEGLIFQADHTVSFQLPKLGFFFSENHQWVGEWHIVKIGLNKSGIATAKTSNYMVQKQDIRSMLKPRMRHDHKGTYGKALLIAGSEGKMGAAILAAGGALRSGVGLLTVHVPKSGVSIMQISVPEAMVQIDQHQSWSSSVKEHDGFDAIGLGPGIGTEKETTKAIGKLLESTSKPLVIDADGLNMLAKHPEYFHLLPANSILTPHLKEFDRLVGNSENSFERLQKQKSLSIKTNCIVVLKGANSCISTPEGEVFFNATGNPGMATGGSGDVLAGIITGLLAQQYSPKQASIIGVYLHGLAGDIAAERLGEEAMLPSDIISSLGLAYQRIKK